MNYNKISTFYNPKKRVSISYELYEPVIIFQCYSKNNKRDHFQGILYKEGDCQIGYDVWRNLHYKDSASHPIFYFASLAELKKEYNILNKKGKKAAKIKRIIKKEGEL